MYSIDETQKLMSVMINVDFIIIQNSPNDLLSKSKIIDVQNITNEIQINPNDFIPNFGLKIMKKIRDKSQHGNIELKLDSENKEIIDDHEKIAFSNLIKRSLRIDYTMDSISQDIINGYGLINMSELNKAIFYHKSFEDYFISCFIMNKLNNEIKLDNKYKLILMQKILLHDINNIIRLFLNHYNNFDSLEKLISKLEGKLLNKVFFKLIGEGLLNLVKFFKEKIKCDVNVKNEDQSTPLIVASEKGYKPIVEYLLEDDKIDLDHANLLKKTAFLSSAEKGHLPVVTFLASGKKKVKNLNEKDFFNNSALVLASKNGHLDIVDYFLKKFTDLNQNKDEINLALIRASESGHLKIVKFLINKGGDVNAKDECDNTCLIYASKKGHKDLVNFLLENSNINDQINKIGYSAYNYAFENEHHEIAGLLNKTFGSENTKTINIDKLKMLNKLFGVLNKPYQSFSDLWSIENFGYNFIATYNGDKKKRYSHLFRNVKLYLKLNFYCFIYFRKVMVLEEKEKFSEDLKDVIRSIKFDRGGSLSEFYEYFIVNQDLFYISEYFEVSLIFKI
jgi:ankyrin repeat protein